MICQTPVEIIDLRIKLILHLLLSTTIQQLVGCCITGINIVVAYSMRQRASIKRCRGFHTFDTRFSNVVVLLEITVEIDKVINVVTISGHTPAHTRRQTFECTFPLFALFRVKMIVAIEAVKLAQVWRFIGRAIRGNETITFNELPGRATLPGAVATKL
ncbi:hypothetical protein D3C80_995230 [compost metagenome]